MKPIRLLAGLCVLLCCSMYFSPMIGQERNPRNEQKAKKKKGGQPGVVKPQMADTIKANIYADNWFVMYINGKLVAVDPIDFLPHNVVSVDILPEYPMTIAVLAKDNADPKTGMEYGNSIGDGGFSLSSVMARLRTQPGRQNHSSPDPWTKTPRTQRSSTSHFLSSGSCPTLMIAIGITPRHTPPKRLIPNSRSSMLTSRVLVLFGPLILNLTTRSFCA